MKFELENYIISIVTVSVIVGMTFGSILASLLVKKFKRTRIAIFCSIFSIIIGVATVFPIHWIYLVVMRFLEGFFASILTTIIPGWLVELADPTKRSILVCTY